MKTEKVNTQVSKPNPAEALEKVEGILHERSAGHHKARNPARNIRPFA